MGKTNKLRERVKSVIWNYGAEGAGISAVVAAAGTFLTGILGGWDMAVQLLITVMAIDFLSGVAAAGKGGKIDSKVALWGGVNKIFVLFLVAVAYQIDITLQFPDPFARTMVIWFYAGREGLSIIENYGKLGLRVPAFLQKLLAQLQDQGDKGSRGKIKSEKEVKGDE